MKNKIIIVKTLASFVSFSLLFFPLYITNAESQATAGVTASVVQQTVNNITINSVSAIKNSGNPDGTFGSGWKWVFDITIPNTTETNLTMKFEDWVSIGSGSFTIPVVNNLRFYSEHSSNASNSSNAIFITGANSYSSAMILTGDIDTSPNTRRVKVTTEFKIPTGTPTSFYSVDFNIRTQ